MCCFALGALNIILYSHDALYSYRWPEGHATGVYGYIYIYIYKKDKIIIFNTWARFVPIR